MDEEKMWKDFYYKVIEETEKKRQEQQEQSSHEARIQEEDGGFFEKLGTRLAEKAQAQQLEESLPPEEEAAPQQQPAEGGENEEQPTSCPEGSAEEREVGLNFCVAERREALYAEKERNLQREPSVVEPPATPVETESESEEHETVYDIVARSVGLNDSAVLIFEMRVRVVVPVGPKVQLVYCRQVMAALVIIPVLGSSSIRGFTVVQKKKKKKTITPMVIHVKSKKQPIEELYAALLYITQHQIGFDIADEVEQDAVIEYLQKAFNIDNETHERVMEETRQMEAPEMHLNIEVVEAKELLPKDANGKSDPFCVLYLESSPTRRYNTAVKTETLTPVWQEHFEMSLENPENDVLYLEVWDFDAAETVPEKMSKVKSVKGVRGLVKLAKEIAITATNGNHDNEFIGSSRIPLKDIPVTGHVMWYSLDKKNKSKRRGMVKLKLAFNTEHDAQVAFQEHRNLLRILLLHELEARKVERYTWCSSWSGPGEVVVLQHAVQRGMRSEQVNLARWIEFAAIHQEHQLSFELFLKLANELTGPVKCSVGQPQFNEQEIRLFWEATKKVLHSGLNLLRKIRRLPIDKENTMKQLIAILRMISTLSTLEVPENVNLFPSKMYSWFPPEILDNDRVSIPEALEFAVIRGGAERFDYILANNNLEGDTDEEALKYHIKVIQLVRIDLQRAMEIYEKLFSKTINFPYTKTLYIMYEKRVSDLCMVIVEDICGRLKRIEIETSEDPELSLGTTLFELYLAIQRFAAVGQNFCPEESESMKVQSYYEWFKAGVAHWLEIAVYKALKRIDKAVEFDNLQPVDSSVQYSSSAVDTLTIFYQIKVFWTQLAWPDIEGAYAFIAKIVDDICKCCITYVDKMSQKAEWTQQRENENSGNSVYGKHYDVSMAWCYAINNIDYIRTSIEPLSKDLGLDSVIESLAESKSQQDADRCKQTLQLIIDNAKDTVRNKIIEMLETVAKKMAPAMNRYLMEGAELSDTTSNSMDRLMDYLDSNLITLHNNLNEDNFQRILMVIWEIMADILCQLVHNNLERRRPPTFYSNLHQTLHTLIQFFNLGADELANVKVLEKIEKLLKLYGLETTELIHRYYMDRLKEQSCLDNEPYGILTVKAYFFNDLLNVQILNGRNLKAIDSNGKCDSYVKIRLFPEDVFVGMKPYKTNVQKETLFPLYEESFSIPLTPAQRKLENAIVMFEMKDKDFLRTRFMAECFLPFSDIQETDSHQGFRNLEQIHLKLSRPTPQSSEVIHVLSRRKGDNLASNFVSKVQSKTNSS